VIKDLLCHACDKYIVRNTPRNLEIFVCGKGLTLCHSVDVLKHQYIFAASTVRDELWLFSPVKSAVYMYMYI